MTRAAAIDIGTNSTRLLIGDRAGDVLRRTVVTGLGRGIGRSGKLSPAGRTHTLEVLASYRLDMEEAGVERCRAVMTAVGRRASDVDSFREAAIGALGVTPQVVSGEEEAMLSYQGAVADLEDETWTVVDIGGGSTEVVQAGSMVSHEIGSVALTDMYLGERPVVEADLNAARAHAASVLDERPAGNGVVGVAGTWTSLAAMSMELDPYDPGRVHHSQLDSATVETWVERLRNMSVEETALLPGLDPARAPVILGGSIVAATVLDRLEAPSCLVSEHDLLDGVVAELL